MVQEIEIADEAAAEAVLQVQRESYAVEAALIEYPALPPLWETVADLQGSGEQFLAYWEGKEVVGVLSFARHEGRLEICRLVVRPSHFGQGVGSALLRAVEGYAAVGERLEVSTAERNHPAVGLYEKHGYAVVQRRTLPDGLRLVGLAKRVG